MSMRRTDSWHVAKRASQPQSLRDALVTVQYLEWSLVLNIRGQCGSCVSNEDSIQIYGPHTLRESPIGRVDL